MTIAKKLPPLHDIIRLLRHSHSEMVEALEQYSQDVGGFNYSAAQRMAGNAFSGAVPLGALLARCEQLSPKAARKPNAEVLRLVRSAGQGREVRPYAVAPRVLRFRSDIEIKISPTFGFVEGGAASIYWLQPRKAFALNLEQLGILVSVIRFAYLVEDFEGVGLELLDLSVPVGLAKRSSTTYRLGDLPLLSASAINDMFTRFLVAFDEAKMPARPRRPSRRPGEDGQFNMELD